MRNNSMVELLVVFLLGVIALTALVFIGLDVTWGRHGDVSPLISIGSVALGAIASLLVRLSGGGNDPVPVAVQQPQGDPVPVVERKPVAPAPTPSPGVVPSSGS